MSILSEQIIRLAESDNVDLSSNAFVDFTFGSWDDWRSHVVVGVRTAWSSLSHETRAAVYLQANSVTAYKNLVQPEALK